MAGRFFRFPVAKGTTDEARGRAARISRVTAAPASSPYEPADWWPDAARIDRRDQAPAFAEAPRPETGPRRPGRRPTIVTLSDLNRRHGTLHTDSRSKVATALVYFNWGLAARERGLPAVPRQRRRHRAMLAPETLPL